MRKLAAQTTYALAGIACLFLLLGCRSAPQTQPSPPVQPKVVLAAGDEIEIKFAYSDQFNETQTIRQDGMIEMQFVGEVAAAGKTPAELRDELMKLYAEHLKYPQLAVMVRSSLDNRVYVGGEVTTPGLVEMPGRLTALEAIMQAGGFKAESAGPGNIIVIRQQDGKNQGIALDLDKALSGQSTEAFYLQPRDIVYVPQSTIVRIDQWIEQNINKIIPDIGFTIQRRSPSGRTTWGYDTSN